MRCWSCSSTRMHSLLAVFAGRFTVDAQGRLDALPVGAQAPQGDGVVAVVKRVEEGAHPWPANSLHGLVVVREPARPPMIPWFVAERCRSPKTTSKMSMMSSRALALSSAHEGR